LNRRSTDYESGALAGLSYGSPRFYLHMLLKTEFKRFLQFCLPLKVLSLLSNLVLMLENAVGFGGIGFSSDSGLKKEKFLFYFLLTSVQLEGKLMKKIFKIVIAVLVVLIISGVASFGLIIGDVAGSFATDTKALPNGAAIGKAMVVYDPGLSGGAKDTATKIGYNLQSSGYDVTLAGVKSSTAADLSSYKVIVIGGPIYAGKPASSIQSYLNALNPPKETKIGVFGYGSVKVDNANKTAVTQDVAPLPSETSVSLNAVVKITSEDNINNLCSEFVTKLLK
jgi:hypothetical protein